VPNFLITRNAKQGILINKRHSYHLNLQWKLLINIQAHGDLKLQ